MKIDLFNIHDFIDINNCKEVTSPILFQRGGVPDPNGLVSNEIFGVTTASRKNTFAYIDLHGCFFHPHVYKAIKRFFRNIDKIIDGSQYYTINEKGNLVVSDMEHGETGIQFLYDNWEKIKWVKSDENGMRNERIEMIDIHKKDEVFIKYLLVIPVFYRDIVTTSKGDGETGELNKYYASLIRLCSLLDDSASLFNFQFHGTNYEIQDLLVEIYDYFKMKLEKKNGMLRKFLMGKNVDYSARTVITAPLYHANRPTDLVTDFRHCGVPISQICALAYPFVYKWVHDFFEREIIDNKNMKIVYNPVTGETEESYQIINPESHFNEKYIKKMIDTYIKDPESRFNTIEVPTNAPTKKVLVFTGKVLNEDSNTETATISNRPMTWTDLLYMACEDVTRDKHCMVTRYPITDEFGIFLARIRVLSTTKTIPVSYNGRVYKWYPYIDFSVSPENMASKFIDSIEFSNSYLKGMGGDYDGDQTTIKILFDIRSNDDCERVMNDKSYFINSSGRNIRVVESEAVQTFYVLTKPSTDKDKTLSKEVVQSFVDRKPEDYTFDFLLDTFGDVADCSKGRNNTVRNSPFKPTDIIYLEPGQYHNKERMKTTLGRLVYTKVINEYCGFMDILGFCDKNITQDLHEDNEKIIANALKDDVITVDQMYRYIDARDWFGLQLHAVITSSFTPGVLTAPKEVLKLRTELLKKHAKELSEGNTVVSEQIEKALVDKTKEVLKDDVGMDLYLSGARGSLKNNFKNINLFRGAVKNFETGGYNIITKSLMDELDKENIPDHSNSILTGAYSKSVAPQVSGYLAKELLAALQTEVLDKKGSDCGTTRTLEIELPTDGSINDFSYRYINDKGKIVCLDSENIGKYKGKVVHMYSPMYCCGNKKCNKCMGDFYYKMNKPNVGLVSSRVATTLTNLNMKKFHDATVKNHTIDINDMLIDSAIKMVAPTK